MPVDKERRQWRDPLTGDLVSTSERFSIAAQSVLRRWTFVLAYVSLSIAWWLTHGAIIGLHDPELFHWNEGASLLALVIESSVGIGMFGWARRDSRVIRDLEARIDRQDAYLERILAHLESDDERRTLCGADRQEAG